MKKLFAIVCLMLSVHSIISASSAPTVIFEKDIDGDGIKELFSFVVTPGNPGSMGCSVNIYSGNNQNDQLYEDTWYLTDKEMMTIQKKTGTEEQGPYQWMTIYFKGENVGHDVIHPKGDNWKLIEQGIPGVRSSRTLRNELLSDKGNTIFVYRTNSYSTERKIVYIPKLKKFIRYE